MANKTTKQHTDIIIDMNEFLITYAASILSGNENVSQKVYDTAKDDINNLDTLFDDDGFGRQEKFVAIGEGYLRDSEQISGDQLIEETGVLTQDALNYLGNHIDQFEHWRTE